MKSSKIAAAFAVSALAFAPIAAQAGTRAGSSPVSVDVSRVSAPSAGENELAAGKFSLVWLLALLAVIAAIISATGGDRTRGG